MEKMRRGAAENSAVPRRRNPDHPPYSEMVQAALQAVADERGATESEISDYIVSTYPGIPPAHSRLLPYYLRNLVAAGILSLSSSGRFLPRLLSLNPKPHLDLPSRWGRHRPRRYTTPQAAAVSQPEARPRLIIRLRRKTDTPATGSSGGVIGWYYMRNDSKEEKSAAVPVSTPLQSEVAPLQFQPNLQCSSPASITHRPSGNEPGNKDRVLQPKTSNEPAVEAATVLVVPDKESPPAAAAAAAAAATPVQLQTEPDLKSLSPPSPVAEESSTPELGKKKGLSSSRRKPQAKHRRLWFEQ